MSSIPLGFMFRLRFSCRRAPSSLDPRALAPEALDASYSAPFWSQIELAEDSPLAARARNRAKGRERTNASLFDFRLAWLPTGLAFTTVVAGKSEQSIFLPTRLEHADSIRLCLDTRDVKESHRASRFCHRFVFYPTVAASPTESRPIAQWAPINRAKASPSPVDVSLFALASERRADGYAFSAFLPSGALTGYDAEEFNRIGLHYIVFDSEHGAFALQHYAPLPAEEDPSLWPSFELT